MENYQYNSDLYHHGIKGQKWGIRRFQNKDGTLTDEGRERYDDNEDIYETGTTDEQKNVNNKAKKGFIIGGVLVATAAAATGTAWYLSHKKNEEKLLALNKKNEEQIIALNKKHTESLNNLKKIHKEEIDHLEKARNEKIERYKQAVVTAHKQGQKVGFNKGSVKTKGVIYNTLSQTPSAKYGFGINWLRKINNTPIRWE